MSETQRTPQPLSTLPASLVEDIPAAEEAILVAAAADTTKPPNVPLSSSPESPE
jgi:hypothetical protein